MDANVNVTQQMMETPHESLGVREPEPSVPHLSDSTAPQKKKASSYCRYFATKNGCRAGTACRFIHDPTRLTGAGYGPKKDGRPQHVSKPSASNDGAQGSKRLPREDPAVDTSTLQQGRRFVPSAVADSRVVKKPVSQAQREDPREFQIQQLRRRFSPTERLEDGGTAFVFQMVPSDPDFPFEMAGLECVLHVPMSYPRNGRPFLDVRNQEMGRGYQINVERGFAALTEGSPQATLLELMNALDKQLESLLTEQKAETVKIIPNVAVGSGVRQAQVIKPTQADANATKSNAHNVPKPPQVYTSEQRRVAQERRDAETRQLEARLGRLPLFFKSSDGIAYTVPISPRRHGDLPVPLQAVKTVKLFVPLLYPLQHCRIEILGVGREAAVNTEKGFERKVKENSEMNLMGHINYLAQHMHLLATEPLEERLTEQKAAPSSPSIESLRIEDLTDKSTTGAALDNEDDRSHIKVIPRPPEWAVGGGEEDTDSDTSDSYDSGDEDSADELDQNNETDPNPDSSTTGPERGILLSFPSLKLHGIELLELNSLSLTIKCDRCKELTDIPNLRNATAPYTESCQKCANTLTISFRRDLMHAHSSRAGYLDLDGCTPLDILPSTFTPTCSACSTAFPPPGIISVRGDSQTTMCRTCHQKMTLHIPSIKFLLTHHTSTPQNPPPPRKPPPKESLGISAGHELPLRGRCAHYRKSHRWFRFSCCARVFPCDKCHDAATGHANEHANRMICGFCGREQNYRPEDCAVCKGVLVGKPGKTGFWEGGRGTRDKGRMSRKDPRKYKRRGGSRVGPGKS